jgi:hypothetical protein
MPKLAINALIVLMAASTTSNGGTSDGDASTRLYLSAAIERIYISAQLAEIGHEQRDPIHLIAAARLLAWGHPYPTPVSMEIRGGEAGETNAPAHIEHTPQALLAEARALVGTDPPMSQVIELNRQWVNDQIEMVASGGPNVHRQELQRGAHGKFRIGFYGRQPARVAVVGSHTRSRHFLTTRKTDLIVRDENDKVVCESRSWRDFEYCEWMPTRDANFSITVENNGPWANLVTIYWN